MSATVPPDHTRRPGRAVAALGALLLLAGCQTYTPFRDANGRANPDMAGVIDTYVTAGGQAGAPVDGGPGAHPAHAR